MKRIGYFFCLLFTIFTVDAHATDFIEGFEDIPLIPRFVQLRNQDFSFSNEDTGYTEAILKARNNQNFNDVKDFYLAVLPQFGWQKHLTDSSQISFTRDKDILDISIIEKRPLKITISLKSRN